MLSHAPDVLPNLPPQAYERIEPCLCGIYLVSAEHCARVRAGIPICPQCKRLAGD